MTDLVTREQKITESVERFTKAGLLTRGYQTSTYDWSDAWPDTGSGKLTKPRIAPGFDFDNPEKAMEMGSTLVQREYSIQVWVFGTNAKIARNLAHAIKFAAGATFVIPLLDISDAAAPQIGVLQVDSTTADQQIMPNPEPWQEHVWAVTIKVTDEYYADQV